VPAKAILSKENAWNPLGGRVSLRSALGSLKPNSITLAGSKLVADRFEAGRRPTSNLSATSFESPSVMEFGFYSAPQNPSWCETGSLSPRRWASFLWTLHPPRCRRGRWKTHSLKMTDRTRWLGSVGWLVTRNLMVTSTEMGDRLRAGKPPRYFTIPPRPTQPLPSAGREMSTSQSTVTLCGWGVKAGMARSSCR